MKPVQQPLILNSFDKTCLPAALDFAQAVSQQCLDRILLENYDDAGGVTVWRFSPFVYAFDDRERIVFEHGARLKVQEVCKR